MTILALDPGLSTAWAKFNLTDRALTLIGYGVERFPGNPHGNAGREQVHQWAARLLASLGECDEVCSDSELAGSNLPTNVPALGAFDAARDLARAHGRRAQGRSVFGQYQRWVYVKMCGRLCGIPVPDGLKRWRPGLREYRVCLSVLTGKPLADTMGDRRHILDALACGLHHAHKEHGWKPANYNPPAKARCGESFLSRVRAKREEVTR